MERPRNNPGSLLPPSMRRYWLAMVRLDGSHHIPQHNQCNAFFGYPCSMHLWDNKSIQKLIAPRHQLVTVLPPKIKMHNDNLIRSIRNVLRNRTIKFDCTPCRWLKMLFYKHFNPCSAYHWNSRHDYASFVKVRCIIEKTSFYARWTIFLYFISNNRQLHIHWNIEIHNNYTIVKKRFF